MQISPDALSSGERLQLASLMLQAWATYQAQGQHAQTSRCAPALATTTSPLRASAAVTIPISLCLENCCDMQH